MLLRILNFSVMGLFILTYIYIFSSVGLLHPCRTVTEHINETIATYSTQPPIIDNCSQHYKVAFTFDDGPHPITTPIIIKTLNQHKIKAGFFILGTSIQSFLSARNSLTVHQFERPDLPFLLLQDYSSLDILFQGHDIYLHGWIHERNVEMRLQTVVDNIAIQLLETGLLKAFKPIYRAPWGVPTTSKNVKDNVLLVQILKQMGIVPADWDIDTKDWQHRVNENAMIIAALRMICKKKGGHILMHDNRPTTAYLLDRTIRSIRASGHTVVSPGEINSKWSDTKAIARTRKYTELLRKRVLNAKRNSSHKFNARKIFHPVEVSLGTSRPKLILLQNIYPTAPCQDSIVVSPNINDI